MLEHITTLNAEDFVDLADMDVASTLDAQTNAATFFQKFGTAPDRLTQDGIQHARNAFAALTNPNTAPDTAKAELLKIKTPAAVMHHVSMLTAYDWEYVQQAKELRGYVVAKLLDETKHPDARIRLAALKALGTVTEVGAFTERVEIKKTDASAEEIVDTLRSKLLSLLPKQVEVETIEARPVSDADGG